MTIHHDKLAYGKLASGMEELSERQLAEMLKLLNEECKEREGEISDDKKAAGEAKNSQK